MEKNNDKKGNVMVKVKNPNYNPSDQKTNSTKSPVQQRLIDEKGRLFGLINPIDLLVLLLIIGLGIKVLSDFRPPVLDVRTQPVTIKLLVRDVPAYVAQSIVVGQDLYQDGLNAYLGKVIQKDFQPAEVTLQKDGLLVVVKSPRNVDLRLEVLRKGGRVITGHSQSGVFLGKLAVRVGDRINCHSLYTRLRGEIEHLQVGVR